MRNDEDLSISDDSFFIRLLHFDMIKRKKSFSFRYLKELCGKNVGQYHILPHVLYM